MQIAYRINYLFSLPNPISLLPNVFLLNIKVLAVLLRSLGTS